MGVLLEMGRGQAVREISNEFAGMMAEVRETGGPGELILKIKVKPEGWDNRTGDVTEVGVSYQVSTKRPKRKIGASTFFLTQDGGLTRNNPDQLMVEFETENERTR